MSVSLFLNSHFFEVWKFKQVSALDIIGRMIRTCEQPKERTTVANETKWCVKSLPERRPRARNGPLWLKQEVSMRGGNVDHERPPVARESLRW